MDTNKVVWKLKKKFGANSVDMYNPTFWANASLMVLEENMVMGNLVYRDFSNVVATKGTMVSTRKPADFTATRYNGSSLTIQDATATNVNVKLDHEPTTNFLMPTKNQAYSIKDLITEFLEPAVISLARYVDQMLCARMYGFTPYLVSTYGGLTSTTAQARIVDARTKLNVNKAPMENRNGVWGPISEGEILKNTDFTRADARGDGGTAFERARIGFALGFQHFMAQNAPYVVSGSLTVATIAVNNAAGYPAGTTTMVIDGAGALAVNLVNGSWFTINGQPYQVVSTSGGPPFSGLTFTPGLRTGAADNDVITAYVPGAINIGAGYAAGYDQTLVVDTFTVAPKVGQGLTIGGNGTSPYMVTGTPTTTSIVLDRPLDRAVVDDAVVSLLPPGSYNLLFHKQAIALVTRPLPMPTSDVKCNVVSHNGLSMRCIIDWNGDKKSDVVTLDLLCGSEILDALLGCLVIG